MRRFDPLSRERRRVLFTSAIVLFPCLSLFPCQALAECEYEERQKVLSSGGATTQRFGAAVEVGSDFAFVGAPNDMFGSVYVQEFIEGAWVETDRLRASDRTDFARFGSSIAVDGDLLIIGASRQRTLFNAPTGAAYVFRFDGATWVEEETLEPPHSAARHFGAAVSISGDDIVVGYQEGSEGRIDLFQYSGSAWVRDRTFVSSDGGLEVNYLAISDGTVLADGSGKVYRFRTSGITQERQQIGAPEDGFGPLAMDGDMSMAKKADGTVRMFHDTGVEFAFLFNFMVDPEVDTIDFSGDVALMGVSRDDDQGADAGAAYIFRRTNQAWVEHQKIFASDAADGDRFGNSVALDGDFGLVGAPEDGLVFSLGAAYSFTAVFPCSAGTVNAGAGPTVDALFVNGSAGGLQRGVSVRVREPITVSLDAALGGPNPGNYALWAWRGRPLSCRELDVEGEILGCTVNPSPFSPGENPRAFRCLRGGLGPEYCAGIREINNAPMSVPFAVTRAQGLSVALMVTLQAVVQDNNSLSVSNLSVTNAVVLDIRD